MLSQPGPADGRFAGSTPITSADDLARPGVFDDAELDAFLADLRTRRETNLA